MNAVADFLTDELMVAVIARELRDDELGFVGLGTADRAFTLAVGIPIAAARLAQVMHAPGFTIYWGNLLSPYLDDIPAELPQDAYTKWPGAASLSDVAFKVDMLTRGEFDVSFESAAQVDQFGNLNITAIGDHAKPKARLVGSLAQTEHLAFVKRPIIVTDLSKRSFVEHVDFITSVGFYKGGGSRKQLGLPGPGPYMVVTDKAVFDFDEKSKRMRIASVHPGVTTEEVLDNMDFEPVLPETVIETVAPTSEEIGLIRGVVDAQGTLLGRQVEQ